MSKDDTEAFDRPARLRDEHILLNPEASERHRRYAVRDDHPLARAYEKGQLECGRRDHTARDRFEAGMIYRGLYEEVYGSGLAASKLMRVNGSVSEIRAGERLCDARNKLGRLMAWLTKDQVFVLNRICGEGYKPAEVVNMRYKGFEKHVTQILCNILDDLVDGVVRMDLHKLERSAQE